MDSLSLLPEHKRKEILEILQIIIEEANPEKVILFGSHARGDWVEDEYIEEGATYSYISNYDFLVMIKKRENVKEYEIASRIENRTLQYKNDVSPLVHDIDYVNVGLTKGQYFFRDIVADGIVLFDTNKYQFAAPVLLSPDQQKKQAERDYKQWIESGERFLEHATENFYSSIKKGYPFNEVIFNLHQAAEMLYGGILLIFTGYKPKTHKLKVYRKYSKHISEELNRVFRYPADDPEEYRLFDLFQKSYLDSKYKDGFLVNETDIEVLIEKMTTLKDIATKLCKEKIRSYLE